jgi:6-phosphofructokinase
MGMKIGILTGGGDCAGLNAVIAAIVKTGTPMGHTFVGFEKSWEGVLDPVMYRDLDLDAVRGISHLGGTILRTTNRGRFAGKTGAGGTNKIPEDILQMAKANLEKLGIEGLIVIGGDGTLAAAHQLAEKGVPIVGVPKTIDNDLSGTDMTFGFSTAVTVAVDALDKIHTTASSHDRVFFVECMGRHAGWISLYAGTAANANAILMPEFSVNVPELVDFLRRRIKHRGSAIVAVAEGLEFEAYAPESGASDAEIKLRGASDNIMLAVEAAAPGEFEMRNVVLGHTQRGGTPVAEDRLLAKRYGSAAIEAMDAGKYGTMVRLRGGLIETIPILEATGSLHRVTKDAHQYQTAQKLGIYLNS